MKLKKWERGEPLLPIEVNPAAADATLSHVMEL